MISKFSKLFNKQLTIIYPGEYYVTTDNVVIATLLGTCISTCLIDDTSGVYGMNHFLLPYQSKHRKHDFLDRNALFGVSAMEYLINTMMKKGAIRKNIKAKVFGAGSILTNAEISRLVIKNNITFVTEFLEAENIPIVSKDIGGDHGRKIYFFTEKKGSVLLKRITNEKIEFRINVKEKSYQEKLIKQEEIKKKKEEFKTSIIFGEDL